MHYKQAVTSYLDVQPGEYRKMIGEISLLLTLGEFAADTAQCFKCHAQVGGDELQWNTVQQLALGGNKMFVLAGGFCEPGDEGAFFGIAIIPFEYQSSNDVGFRIILVEILQVVIMQTCQFAIFNGLHVF